MKKIQKNLKNEKKHYMEECSEDVKKETAINLIWN